MASAQYQIIPYQNPTPLTHFSLVYHHLPILLTLEKGYVSSNLSLPKTLVQSIKNNHYRSQDSSLILSSQICHSFEVFLI